jgi:very-short-patch-repair endonuclease
MAAERDGVLSIHQLRSCGLDDDAVAVRVRRGSLHRMHRGVYAVGHAGVTLNGRFRAAVLACGPRGVLSHFAAAALWGFLPWEERYVEVTVVGGRARRIPGLSVHRARSLRRVDVDRRHGFLVTSPARTLLDLAAVLPQRALRRAARRALAERVVSVAELGRVAARYNGHRGAGRLRALLAGRLAPTRSDLEDDLLDLLDEAGIERPEVNAPLRLSGRTIVPDYLWRERRLAVEADGASWHDDPLTRENDADKQAILEAHGIRVLRVTWTQATTRPEQTVARIRAALGC